MKRRILTLFAIVLLAGVAYQLVCLLLERTLPVPSALRDVRTTEHFVIHSDNTEPDAIRQAEALEAFASWFQRSYFAFSAPERLRIYSFANPGEYVAYCRWRCARKTPFGFYDPDKNTAVFNAASGIGTTCHELVHYFIAFGTRERPPAWIGEGVAAFFEKVVGHVDEHGQAEITVGYFNPWRFEQVKAKRRTIDLRELTHSSRVDESVARALMLFLHRHHELTPFIRALATRTGIGDGVRLLEDICGKPLDEIDREFKAWIEAQPLDADVELVQRSLILSSGQWSAWLSANQGRLRFDPAEQRFEPR